jgi:hypothetical protein
MKMGIMTNVNQTTGNEEKIKDEIVVITKSWRGHVLFIVFFAVCFIELLQKKSDTVFLSQLCLILAICDQFLRIFTSKIEINIERKEAKMSNFYGTRIIKNIQSIATERSLFLLFASSIEISGVNDSILLASIKESSEIEKLLNTFEKKI